MNAEQATMVVESMAAIPFFPGEAAARGLISSELQRICGSVEQGAWLARRMTQLYERWPGLREMRAVYCGKFRPCDGIEADSTVYGDGIPSERESQSQISAPQADLQEPEGKLLAEVAQSCSMPK